MFVFAPRTKMEKHSLQSVVYSTCKRSGHGLTTNLTHKTQDVWIILDKKFELIFTRRAKAYSSSGLVVTHRSTNRARRRVTSFQPKRVTNYATPPMLVSWRHLVNDIALCSRPKSPPAPGSMNLGDRDLDC